MDYETVIGLEVHAQLKTQSKMYCGCSTDYASTPPNTHVCTVCLGLPGVLPVINRRAIEFTIMTGLALNCTVAEETRFDRKNYPYPDLMKGYQISQSYQPIASTGHLTIEVDGATRRIGVNHVHLEEDVAKLLHRAAIGESYSLVDVNRSGVPLMEVVSEPDLRSPEEARQYLIKLRSILRYIDVSTANMEEGSFRCDANISIRPVGAKELGPKVEVKNLNSFKAVYLAMEYEAQRQRKAAAEGERLVQETRGWLDGQGRTVSQRSKEYAHDYRYFPEPDLPPLAISRQWVDEIKARLPELPEAKRERFVSQYELPAYDAALLTSDRELADLFEKVLETDNRLSPKEVSNWLLGPSSAIMNAHNIGVAEFREKVPPVYISGLVVNVSGGIITASTGRTVLEETFNTGKDPAEIIQERGLGQISDAQAIEDAVAQAVESSPQAVKDFRAGKESALKFLVGQVMRATRGRANPQMVNDLLKKKLTGV